MAGKVLKISSNDLYGNVDERKVCVFACFEHTKYMNNYAIFSFEGEYEKNILYYGSIHLKNNSIVVFSVKENVKPYIEKFVEEFISNNIENYKILDIDCIDKVELVSYSEMDYDNLLKLDEISIKRVSLEVKEEEKKPIFLYFLIIVLFLSAVGLTALYLYPAMFVVKYKQLVCDMDMYDNEIQMNYSINKDIKFDQNDKVEVINVEKEYIFLDSNSYFEFKDNNYFEQYFTNGELYKFIDESLVLKLMYKETSVIDEYDEMLNYLKKEGFSCVEKEYEK